MRMISPLRPASPFGAVPPRVPSPRPASTTTLEPISALRPCPGCGRTFCTCPRKGWGIVAASSGVQPGKGTQPIKPGTVRPPIPSQLPPSKRGGRR